MLQSMFRLRHEVFRERLGWDVTSVAGLERDGYDALAPVYGLSHVDGRVNGCWRLLPTTGAYMLRDLFPELLEGADAPSAPDVWEVSRFAVLCPPNGRSDSFAGTSQITGQLLEALLEFGLANGVTQIVAASDVRFERVLKRAGLRSGRFAPSRRLGNTRSVAGWTDVTSANLARVRNGMSAYSAAA